MTLIARLMPLLAILICWPALAHEGHDHGDAPAAVAQALPRVQSRSDVFELVAVASGHKLTIYLSDFKTNAPVPEATVEVAFEGKSVPAVRRGEGVYQITADWLDVPGAKPLVFTVLTPAVSDLLDGVLEIAQPPAAAAYNVAFADLVRSRLLWAWTLLAAATGFVIALAFARRAPAGASGVRAAAEQRSAPQSRAASILLVGVVAIAGLLLPVPQALAASHDHGSEGEALIGIDMARRLPDGSVFMPKPAQWLLGVRTSITEIAKAARTIEMVGTVIPDPSASGRVQASLAGRVEVANGQLPHVGQACVAGRRDGPAVALGAGLRSRHDRRPGGGDRRRHRDRRAEGQALRGRGAWDRAAERHRPGQRRAGGIEGAPRCAAACRRPARR